MESSDFEKKIDELAIDTQFAWRLGVFDTQPEKVKDNNLMIFYLKNSYDHLRHLQGRGNGEVVFHANPIWHITQGAYIQYGNLGVDETSAIKLLASLRKNASQEASKAYIADVKKVIDVEKRIFELTKGAMKELVEKEIAQFNNEKGCRGISKYLNNFLCHFPRNSPYGGYYRSHWEIEEWKTKHKDISYDGKKFMRGAGYSKLFMEQSPKEFYAAFDRAIKSVSLNIEEIKELKALGKDQKLLELAPPIFIRLRQIGYKRYPDLIA